MGTMYTETLYIWSPWNRRKRNLSEWDIKGRIEAVQTTALLRSAGILKRVLLTQGDLQSLSIKKQPLELGKNSEESRVSSTETGIDTRLIKAWTATDRLSVIWKSNLTDKVKRSFLHAVIVSILLYGCTIWTLSIRLEKKLDGNYTRMLQAILNWSWRQHPTKQQLYGHLPPITKTIQIRRTRHSGYCWRRKDKLISDVLQWNPTHNRAKAGRPARTYLQKLCEDTECSPEDLPKAMNDREG